MSQIADDEVSQLLHSWGLSDLKAKFKANYIILQAFEYLTEDDIIELIPKIGQRAIFRGRLLEWRQKNGLTAKVPPVKMSKLEPLIDEKTKQLPDDLNTPPPEPQQVTEQKSPTKLNHKIYGTLTKCTQPPKKLTAGSMTINKSAIQSKVQQFYISPMAESCPPLIDPKPDLTPFVTSIIRVETNCDKTYLKNSNIASSDTPTKVNRTTILQKLNNCESTATLSPKQNTQPQTEEPSQDQPPEEEQADCKDFYPIIKLEPGSAETETNWDEYTEPEQDEPAERELDKLTTDSQEFPTEYVESLESEQSAPEFDSENEKAFKMERIVPKASRSRSRNQRKRTKPLGKLDIRHLLMNSDMGRHVLNYYETNEHLDLGRRRLLIDAIVQDCWLSNRRISPTDCYELAVEITEILPNERMEDYYEAQMGKNPKSPIYNKYRNMHRRFRIKNGRPTPIHKKRKHLPNIKIDGIEIDDNTIIS